MGKHYRNCGFTTPLGSELLFDDQTFRNLRLFLLWLLQLRPISHTMDLQSPVWEALPRSFVRTMDLLELDRVISFVCLEKYKTLWAFKKSMVKTITTLYFCCLAQAFEIELNSIFLFLIITVHDKSKIQDLHILGFLFSASLFHQ